MGVYKVNREVVLVPYKYIEADGKPADHEQVNDESQLAVDERGNPVYAHFACSRGTLVYDDASAFDALEDDQKKDAFFTDSASAINRYVEKGALVEQEVQPKKQQSSSNNTGKSNNSKSSKSE